jgi:hypothetical protein
MLNGLPYLVKRAIAQRLDPFYIHTLGSSCSEWRAFLRSNQRVLSNRRTLPGAGRSGDYSTFVPRFPNADTLRLYGNGNRNSGEAFDLSSLGAYGAVGATRIRTLGLSFCTFAPSTFKSLASCELTSLQLDTSAMRGVVARIAPTLAKMSSLVSLGIRNNMIGSSAPELARAIVALTNLEFLCLARNELGATGATALAPSLGVLARLRSLDLSRNLIGCAGATALATTLSALSALTDLNIDANAIGAQGFAALRSRGLARLTGTAP